MAPSRQQPPPSSQSSAHAAQPSSHHPSHHHHASSSGRSSLPRSTKHPKDPKEQLKRRGSDLIRKISNKDRYAIFLEPVDIKVVPHYAYVITRPMDLSSVQKNLDMGVYRTPMEMKADLDLIWSNCCTFNADDSMYYREAVRLRPLCARYYDELIRLLIRDGVAASLGIQIPSLADQHQQQSSTTHPSHASIQNNLNNSASDHSNLQSMQPSFHPHHDYAYQQSLHHSTHPHHPLPPQYQHQLNPHQQNLSKRNRIPGIGPSTDIPGVGLQSDVDSESIRAVAGRHIAQVRHARLDLKAADEAVAVARTEVEQTARKAGIPIPSSGDDLTKTKPQTDQIFNGPANLLQSSSNALKLFRNPAAFPIVSKNPTLARAAQPVPYPWSRVGRQHANLPPPFLSRARAQDVRHGRMYQKYVTRCAPIARRLLASVLDASVVQRADEEIIRKRKRERVRRHNRHDEDDDIEPEPSAIKSEAMDIDDVTDVEQDDDDTTFLTQLVGKERAHKVARTSKAEDVKSKPKSKTEAHIVDAYVSSSPPSTTLTTKDSAICELRTLLQSKGLSTDFLTGLTSVPVNPTASGKQRSKHGDTNTNNNNHNHNHNNSKGVELHPTPPNDTDFSRLLNANYQGMLNCLRLRSLRDAVNEAEREEIEDRERECVECVAKGVAKAVSYLPPRLLIHPLDATESALGLCATIQTSNRVGAGAGAGADNIAVVPPSAYPTAIPVSVPTPAPAPTPAAGFSGIQSN